MRFTRRYAPVLLVCAALSCAAVGLIAGAPARAQPELMPGSPPEVDAPEALLADIELLRSLNAMDLTADQALRAAALLEAVAEARDKEAAARGALAAQSEDALAAARSELLRGADLSLDLKAQLDALQEDLRESRRAVAEALREAQSGVEALITPEQAEALTAARKAELARARGGARVDPLLAVRQWSDPEYAEKRDKIIERLAGKDADDARKAEVSEALALLRALSDEELDARLPEIRTALSGRAAAPKAGGGEADADPFGAPGPAMGAAGAGRGAAALMAVRRLDDARYATTRDRMVEGVIRRAGADPADADLAAKVGALLDRVRALGEAELAAAMPGVAAEFAELLPGIGRERRGTAMGPEAPERGARGLVAGLFLGDARRVAGVLREYAAARS